MVLPVEFALVADEIAERSIVIGVLFAARFEVIAEHRLDVRHGRSAFGREGIGDIGRLPIFRQRAEPFFLARASFFLTFFF